MRSTRCIGGDGEWSRRAPRSRTRRHARAATLVAAVAMVVAGCTADDTGADPTNGPTGASATPTDGAGTPSDDGATPTPMATATTDAPTPTAGVTGSATTPPDASTGGDDLPGDDIISIWQDGQALAVVGVAHNDVLNIRDVPGTGGDVVATAAPTADDLVATGTARLLPGSIWVQVEVGGVTGWANASFLAVLDGTSDATAQYRAMDRQMAAKTMRRLGRVVARGFVVDEGEVTPRIVRVVAPSHGDLSEVTYDVIGLADDSVLGLRLHVFGEKRPVRGGFRLRTIEQTLLCARGGDGEACT